MRGLRAFDGQGDPHPATDAKSGKATPQRAGLEGVYKGDKDTRPRSADRVAEGDGTAKDIGFFGIELEVTDDGESLGGESFIGFDEIKLACCPSSPLEGLLRGGDRSEAHDIGFDACGVNPIF